MAQNNMSPSDHSNEVIAAMVDGTSSSLPVNDFSFITEFFEEMGATLSPENKERLLSMDISGLTEEQQVVYRNVIEWLSNEVQGRNARRIKGFAGTGKTVLISFLMKAFDSIGLPVAINTFTWKAALALKAKGVTRAASIHSLFYDVGGTNSKGEPFFKKVLPEDIRRNYSLIIIDEASMVNSEMQEDVESSGVPVLYVGDAGQLPAISKDDSDKTFMKNAEWGLTTVLRQALDSPIIKLSMDIREGKRIPYKNFGKGIAKIYEDELSDRSLLATDIIICGKNKTRKALNTKVRTLLGMNVKRMPAKGEPVIGMRNVLSKGLYNGQIWYAVEDYSQHPLSISEQITMVLENEDGSETRICQCIFPESEIYKTFKDRPDVVNGIIKEKDLYEVDFGYAITCHKSQGSQWDKVIVFEEYLGDREFHKQWLYTAVTRSAQKLIIVS